jgi:hypothetical protein
MLVTIFFTLYYAAYMRITNRVDSEVSVVATSRINLYKNKHWQFFFYKGNIFSERYYSGQMEPVDATVSTAMSLTSSGKSPGLHSPQDK